MLDQAKDVFEDNRPITLRVVPSDQCFGDSVMKKILMLLVLMTMSLTAQVVVIHHHSYITHFSKQLKYPVEVEWTLTRAMLDCPDRTGRRSTFTSDPDCPGDFNVDYHGSGYDRGHNMDALDNECNGVAETECFYFTNMTPQTPALNRGPWEVLESWCRKLAETYGEVRICCGSFGSVKRIGPDSISVPRWCWKVVYVPEIATETAYLYENTNLFASKKPVAFEIDIMKLKKLTGIAIDSVLKSF